MSFDTVKRVALILFAGTVGLAFLQTTAAQKHTVNVTVQEVNKVTLPASSDNSSDPSVTIDIDPSTGDFTGSSDKLYYEVTTNSSNNKKVQVKVANLSNGGELNDFSVSTDGNTPPNSESNEVTLVTDGSKVSNYTDLTSGFTNVDGSYPVTYSATVSPKFGTGNTATVKVLYNITAAN